MCRAEVVAIVNTKSMLETKHAVVYNVTLEKVIKTSRDISGVQLVTTPKSPGYCGTVIGPTGKYIITGTAADNAYDLGKTSIKVNICSYIPKWSELTVEQKNVIENFKQTQCTNTNQ
ncbi:hypothetical protein B4U80_13573 [Leptotrombidium deliense]|uniref:NTR domain-containing protein n=1 Tax=Leptotrombidium deliense TaxID=299467 RepID=A0A443S4C1_9ACAR|nr:hypothetical protein B4U80_13573 [Leptotrombidium deliense]